MPQIDFDEGYKRKGMFDYDKLTLESQEKARVCVIDQPIMEYVHTLRKIITENGQPIMVTEKYGKAFEKTREVPKNDFVGKYICLGEIEVLKDKGVDKENCPACQLAAENGAAVEVAKRRFVVHVLKYETKKNSFNLLEPYGAKLLAWEFAESRFSSLVDIRVEHGKLNEKDLNLGPCENKTFQKYEITPGASCEWRSSEERMKQTVAIIKAQRAEDLSPLLGRRVEAYELKSVVQDIVDTYNRAFGHPGSMPSSPVNTNTSTAADDIEDLLSGSTTPKEEPKAEKAPDDLSGLEEFAASREEPKEEVKEEPKTPKSGVEDLDDLLADLEA